LILIIGRYSILFTVTYMEKVRFSWYERIRSRIAVRS